MSLPGRYFAVLCFGLSISASAGPAVQLPSNPTVYTIKRDAAGNVYLAGDLLVSGRAFDAFVAKVASDGTLAYFTTFGGTRSETITAFALTADGSVVAVGGTNSFDFPVTADAAEKLNLYPLNQPSGPGFVAKLDSGGHVSYASYLNGDFTTNGGVAPLDVALDSSGAAFITGSGAFAAAGGALANTGMPAALFVLKLDPSGKLVFSSNAIGGNRIALGQDGAIYVAGSAESPTIPVPAGALQSTIQLAICGGSNGPGVGFGILCSHQYVAKLDSAASQLIYSTWLSGRGNEGVAALLVDAGGNAILGGSTGSSNYPVTAGAYQTTIAAQNPPSTNSFAVQAPPNSGYVTKLNATGTGLIFSTFLGGSSDDSISSLALDASGQVVIAGMAASPDFPGVSGVANACRPNYINPIPFVTRLTADGSALTSTRLAFALPAITPRPNTSAGIGAAAHVTTVDASGRATVQDGSIIAEIDLQDAPKAPLTCVTDAADYTPLSHVAPGQLVTLFGDGFAPDSVSVTFNGTPAPLLYASGVQVNAQVPYALGSAATVSMEIHQGASGTLVGQQTFLAASQQPAPFVQADAYATCPGALTAPGLPAVALNPDLTLVSCTNPAAGGSVVSVYLNGLGAPGPHSVAVNGADLVSFDSSGAVAVLRVRLPSVVNSTAAPVLFPEFTVTIDGVALRFPLAVPAK